MKKIVNLLSDSTILLWAYHCGKMYQNSFKPSVDYYLLKDNSFWLILTD